MVLDDQRLPGQLGDLTVGKRQQAAVGVGDLDKLRALPNGPVRG